MNKQELKNYLLRDSDALRSLNFSENYIREMMDNTGKWAATGILGGLDDPHVGRTVATLLENQRVLNESKQSYSEFMPEGASAVVDVNQWAPQWRRCSIPVIRRAFHEGFVGYHLVSVQAMRMPQENTYLQGFDGRTVGTITSAKTRSMKSHWDSVTGTHGDFQYRGESYGMALDAEANATADYAAALTEEMGREIIWDLTNNVGSNAKYDYKDEAHLMSLVEGMSDYIGAKIHGHKATWVVTSPTIVKLLGEHIEKEKDLPENREGITRIGTLGKKWTLWEDSLSPEGNVLMGYKRGHYLAGYVYAPFQPVSPTPAWVSGDMHGHGKTLARYGKRLENANFYGLIKLENLPQTQLEEGGAPSDTK